MKITSIDHELLKNHEYKLINQLNQLPNDIAQIIFFQLTPCVLCEWFMQNYDYLQWLKTPFAHECEIKSGNEKEKQFKNELLRIFNIQRYPVVDFLDKSGIHYIYYPVIHKVEDLFVFEDRLFQNITFILSQLHN